MHSVPITSRALCFMCKVEHHKFCTYRTCLGELSTVVNDAVTEESPPYLELHNPMLLYALFWN